MAIADQPHATRLPHEPIKLDPFAFFQDMASRIEGLGGSKSGQDPRYVFHTPYVEVGRGRATFSVLFRGLSARRGTLVLYVNMLAVGGKSFARLITSERIRLNRLASTNGHITIEFEAYRNMSFAILGHINDDTDASAGALEVWLHPPAASPDDAQELEEGHSTAFRAKDVRPAAYLLDVGSPSFANPVSQACTMRQLRETAFQYWAKRFNAGSSASRTTWEEAYILQVAKRYGALEPEARAVGLGVFDSALPQVMHEHGLSVTVTTPSDHDIAPPSVPGAMETIPAGIVDVPRALVNFDLLWSRGVMQRMVGHREMMEWVEASLRCLRPGGLAIHVTDVARTTDGVKPQPTDIERLALSIISRGHDVARMKFARTEDVPVDEVTTAETTSFGLIIRRAAAPF